MRHAIDRGYDIVVVLHGDVQYAPERIPDLINRSWKVRPTWCSGSRMTGHPCEAACRCISSWRTSPHRIETGPRHQLSEYHSGFRPMPAKRCTGPFDRLGPVSF